MGYSLIQWSVMADRNYGKMQSKKKTPAKIPLYQIQYVNARYERRSNERKREREKKRAILSKQLIEYQIQSKVQLWL